MWPFTPSWLKKAKELEKAGQRFINYKRDRLRPETTDRIETCLSNLRAARRGRDQAACQEQGNTLEALCESAAPRGNAVLRENVEVFFVALVIALSIKSFILQPFMIPTGSMQPTLNGVKGMPVDSLVEDLHWNPLEKVGQRMLAGRKIVNEHIDQPRTLVSMRERTSLRFLVWTELVFEGGKTRKVWMPINTLLSDFGFRRQLATLGVEQGVLDPGEDPMPQGALKESIQLPQGLELAHGILSLGDQVLVDRISYHFRAPKRGEVFVFTTANIAGLKAEAVKTGLDAQHYIKRLAGVPGDRLEIFKGDSRLYVDGELATEAGFVDVGSQKMTKEGRFSGYQLPRPGISQHPYSLWPVEEGPKGIQQELELRDKEYAALGDNSASSLDSRYWGPVPEQNLVGPALISYWPFHSHWGTIE